MIEILSGPLIWNRSFLGRSGAPVSWGFAAGSIFRHPTVPVITLGVVVTNLHYDCKNGKEWRFFARNVF